MTPTIEHPFHWLHLSVCVVLAYRWDGTACREFFQVIGGSYDAELLIEFLKKLKRSVRGEHVYLIWDNVKIHKNTILMQEYLAAQADWLHVEFLPGYAPELNPVEYDFGNIKGAELANRCSLDVGQLIGAVEDGLDRVRKNKSLIFGFLKHAGLSLGPEPSG